MLLEILSPEELIYKGEVALVQMPGEKGSFEVLVNHAPLVALLESGKIKIIDSSRNLSYMTISGGMVKVKDNQITVLLTSA